METNRLETLEALVAQNPTDAFSRYGLAMEYVRLGRLEEAVTEFRSVIASHPAYCYAYFHGGQTLEKLERFEEARQLYEQGIAAARSSNDAKALSELQAALDLLPI